MLESGEVDGLMVEVVEKSVVDFERAEVTADY